MAFNFRLFFMPFPLMFHLKIFHNKAICRAAYLNLLSIHETGRVPCLIIIKVAAFYKCMSKLFRVIISRLAPLYNYLLNLWNQTIRKYFTIFNRTWLQVTQNIFKLYNLDWGININPFGKNDKQISPEKWQKFRGKSTPKFTDIIIFFKLKSNP